MKVFGLIGEKLSHSMSPEIHNEIFKILKVKGAYSLYEVEKQNLSQVITALKVLNINGINVTIPYKEEIIKYLDGVSKEAQKIGAVNTVINKNGSFIGYNTDYYGFGRMLKKFNVNLKDKKVAVLGSGGAAKAVVQYIVDNNPYDIAVVSRDVEKAKISFKDYDVIGYRDLKKFKGDIIVNTTPVGMFPKAGFSPVDEDIIKNFNTAVDIIFNPAETEFLKMARENGLKYINGLYMLVGQAIKAEEIWQGVEISEESQNNIYNNIKSLMETGK